MLVLEVRRSESHASINNGGHFQTETVGVEAHVKDGGQWNFYGFDVAGRKPQESAKAVPHTAGCFQCHRANTAVEDTFVEFNPSLYAVAESKNTFNPGFARMPVTPNKLVATILSEGWNKGSLALKDAAAHAPDSTVVAENSLNSMSYQLMNSQHNQEAVSMLEFATARYPQSANLEDSLSEAYDKAGNAAASRAATEKSLALLKSDTKVPEERKQRILKGAEERLQRLK